jgi:hypothetical protein
MTNKLAAATMPKPTTMKEDDHLLHPRIIADMGA